MKVEWLERDNVTRVRSISVEEFVTRFEEPNKPVLLERCLDDWIASEKWSREYLIKVVKDVEFAVGPVEMKLENYFRYSDQVREERALYLFDPKFAEKVPVLDSEYDVPVYFREDFVWCSWKGEAGLYRWIITGPAGSGSSFHIDPNSTSAWNAVITGSKKWVLFPPDVVPPGVHPSPDGAEDRKILPLFSYSLRWSEIHSPPLLYPSHTRQRLLISPCYGNMQSRSLFLAIVKHTVHSGQSHMGLSPIYKFSPKRSKSLRKYILNQRVKISRS